MGAHEGDKATVELLFWLGKRNSKPDSSVHQAAYQKLNQEEVGAQGMRRGLHFRHGCQGRPRGDGDL